MSENQCTEVVVGKKVTFQDVTTWEQWVREWNQLLRGDSARFLKEPDKPFLFSRFESEVTINLDCILGLLHRLHSHNIMGEKIPFLFRLALDPEIKSTELWTKPLEVLTACYLKKAWAPENTGITHDLLNGRGLPDVIDYFLSEEWHDWCNVSVSEVHDHTFYALKDFLVSLCKCAWVHNASEHYPELYARKDDLFNALVHSGDAILILTKGYLWDSLTAKHLGILRTYIMSKYECFQQAWGRGCHIPERYPLAQGDSTAQAYVIIRILVKNKKKKMK